MLTTYTPCSAAPARSIGSPIAPHTSRSIAASPASPAAMPNANPSYRSRIDAEPPPRTYSICVVCSSRTKAPDASASDMYAGACAGWTHPGLARSDARDAATSSRHPSWKSPADATRETFALEPDARCMITTPRIVIARDRIPPNAGPIHAAAPAVLGSSTAAPPSFFRSAKESSGRKNQTVAAFSASASASPVMKTLPILGGGAAAGRFAVVQGPRKIKRGRTFPRWRWPLFVGASARLRL
mmetsp:Transcript_27894/g.64887  ORF Transcript_27894/g.64887 Transcript_27894/m.64887 type:complete len:242 (-) Transcript_27894:83-808(-)